VFVVETRQVEETFDDEEEEADGAEVEEYEEEP
jgi:hypothetical protein